jgi:hypothetical protein
MLVGTIIILIVKKLLVRSWQKSNKLRDEILNQ